MLVSNCQPFIFSVNMTSVSPFLFLIMLVPFLFRGLSQGIEVSEAQRLAQRKMLICVVMCLPLFFLLLLIISIVPIGHAEGMFITTVFPIPCMIALLCCRYRIYPRSPNDPSIVTIVIVSGIILTCLVLVAVWNYHGQVELDRKALGVRQELLKSRLPTATPPDETLEERIERLKLRLAPNVLELDE